MNKHHTASNKIIDDKIKGVEASLASKGTGNKTSQVLDDIIRDGSHLLKDGTLKPDVKMLSIKQVNMSIYMRQTTWGDLKSLMQMT